MRGSGIKPRCSIVIILIATALTIALLVTPANSSIREAWLQAEIGDTIIKQELTFDIDAREAVGILSLSAETAGILRLNVSLIWGDGRVRSAGTIIELVSEQKRTVRFQMVDVEWDAVIYIDWISPVNPITEPEQEYSGTVGLDIWVDKEGAVYRIDTVKSSGDKRLDHVARLTVERTWLFPPAE